MVKTLTESAAWATVKAQALQLGIAEPEITKLGEVLMVSIKYQGSTFTIESKELIKLLKTCGMNRGQAKTKILNTLLDIRTMVDVHGQPINQIENEFFGENSGRELETPPPAPRPQTY